MTFNLDMISFWQQGDVISHAVLLLLLIMSVTSWAIIISKSVQTGMVAARQQRCAGQILASKKS